MWLFCSSLSDASMDEKRLLAQLPPPPPPPPLLPCSKKAPMPSTSNTAFDNTSSMEYSRDENIEENLVSLMTPTTPCSSDSPSSIRTPPSIPCYRSPSKTSIEPLHSVEASTSSTASVTKIDSERIKEMASALQAVFARLGNVPPPPVAPQLDANENNLVVKTGIPMISDPVILEEIPTIPSTIKHMTTEPGRIKSGLEHTDVISGASVICTVDHELAHSADVTQGTSSASNNLLQESGISTPLQPVLSLSGTTQFVEEVSFTFEIIFNCVLEVTQGHDEGNGWMK